MRDEKIMAWREQGVTESEFEFKYRDFKVLILPIYWMPPPKHYSMHGIRFLFLKCVSGLH